MSVCACQVLEPKDGKVIYKDWDAMGSDISKLETFDDDEQPLPQNVSC
jgi:ATP-dependent Clp protease protease subunit